MREIKFRGKRIEDNKWIYGSYIKELHQQLTLVGYNHYIREMNEKYTTYLVAPETVGEYKGLEDKNGKEIYEGDIVQQFDIKENGIIKYKYGQFGISSLGMFWNIHPTKLEVIGNIYENKELLEVKE